MPVDSASAQYRRSMPMSLLVSQNVILVITCLTSDSLSAYAVTLTPSCLLQVNAPPAVTLLSIHLVYVWEQQPSSLSSCCK
ncbi:hypothetical protein DENSPDRAFT_845965 [Dentipellis sp. KUC8613]|nr:hypothetical protein DENSPDRAFT_845965 [Dentipellis sp. KUC8613]